MSYTKEGLKCSKLHHPSSCKLAPFLKNEPPCFHIGGSSLFFCSKEASIPIAQVNTLSSHHRSRPERMDNPFGGTPHYVGKTSM